MTFQFTGGFYSMFFLQFCTLFRAIPDSIQKVQTIAYWARFIIEKYFFFILYVINYLKAILIIINSKLFRTMMKLPYYSSIREQESIYRQGLPNTGNICYLNSILQFLYSSSIFKTTIEEVRLKKEKTSLIYHLYRVFFSISAGGLLQKEESLHMLIRKIEQINKDIYCHSQQDFFQVLMIILNQIFEEYPPFEELLSMLIESSCLCCNYQSLRYYLPYSLQYCCRCYQFVQTKIIKESPLIIIKTQQKEVRSVEWIKQISQNTFYQCTGKIFYFGNSFQGHYLASRLYKDTFYSFNDQSVYPEIDEYPMILLYQTMNFDNISNSYDLEKEVDIKGPALVHQSKKQANIEQTQIWASQDNQITVSPVYRSLVNIVVKVTASKVIKKPRQLYCRFEITRNGRNYHIKMDVINKDCFVILPSLSIKKMTQNIKACLKTAIQRFLNDFQREINQLIEHFYRSTGHKQQEKQNYSMLYHQRQSLINKYKTWDTQIFERSK